MNDIKIWDYWADKYERLWVQKYSLGPSRKAIIKELETILKKDQSYEILDMGCGTGQLLREIQERFKHYTIHCTGVDQSAKMIEEAKKKSQGIQYKVSAVDTFKAEKKQYDIILCSHSFPYYINKEKVIAKFTDLLAEQGSLMMVQASQNTIYDSIAMFFVKFTTSKAQYLSVPRMKQLLTKYFPRIEATLIKERWYMPSLYLFISKKGETDEDSTDSTKTS